MKFNLLSESISSI